MGATFNIERSIIIDGNADGVTEALRMVVSLKLIRPLPIVRTSSSISRGGSNTALSVVMFGLSNMTILSFQ